MLLLGLVLGLGVFLLGIRQIEGGSLAVNRFETRNLLEIAQRLIVSELVLWFGERIILRIVNGALPF